MLINFSPPVLFCVYINCHNKRKEGEEKDKTMINYPEKRSKHSPES